MDNQIEFLLFISFAGWGRPLPAINTDPDPVGAEWGWTGIYTHSFPNEQIPPESPVFLFYHQ